MVQPAQLPGCHRDLHGEKRVLPFSARSLLFFSYLFYTRWVRVLDQCPLSPRLCTAREEEASGKDDRVFHRRSSGVFQHRQLQFPDGHNL